MCIKKVLVEENEEEMRRADDQEQRTFRELKIFLSFRIVCVQAKARRLFIYVVCLVENSSYAEFN